MDFARRIREIPDFPRPGIRFNDISPLVGGSVLMELPALGGRARWARDKPLRAVIVA